MRTAAVAYSPVLSRAAFALAGVIILSLGLYGVFLMKAVSEAAALTEAQKEIRALTAVVSGLEEDYLSKTRLLTLERARTLGFVPSQSVTTVYASDADSVVTRAGLGARGN